MPLASRVPTVPRPIAARRRLRCWSSTPAASCCVPGAVPPIRAISPPNASRNKAASGQTASTASMSTAMTMSGWAAIPLQAARRRWKALPRWPHCGEQPSAGAAAEALDHQHEGRRRLCRGIRHGRQFQVAGRRHAPRRPTPTTPMAASTARLVLYQPTDMFLADTQITIPWLYISDGSWQPRMC